MGPEAMLTTSTSRSESRLALLRVIDTWVKSMQEVQAEVQQELAMAEEQSLVDQASTVCWCWTKTWTNDLWQPEAPEEVGPRKADASAEWTKSGPSKEIDGIPYRAGVQYWKTQVPYTELNNAPQNQVRWKPTGWYTIYNAVVLQDNYNALTGWASWSPARRITVNSLR